MVTRGFQLKVSPSWKSTRMSPVGLQNQMTPLHTGYGYINGETVSSSGHHGLPVDVLYHPGLIAEYHLVDPQTICQPTLVQPLCCVLQLSLKRQTSGGLFHHDELLQTCVVALRG